MTDIENTQQAETEEQVETEEPTAPPEEEQEETTEEAEEEETFPASVVRDLRKENARYRDRAKAADDLREALWQARVAATGRLADPTDLAMPEDADPLDVEQLNAAVDDLLARKPHLAARSVTGAIGQGGGSTDTASVDLVQWMRG